MKSTKKAFTLVELIVVITILAVLATVAFISLTGYSQDAKNSKVTSDVRTLVSAVEAKMTKDGTLPRTLVTTGAFDANTMVNGTGAYASGAILTTSNYAVGEMDFQALGQNGDDFNADGKKYAVAGAGTYYQIAGEILEDAQFTAVVKGNYVTWTGANVVDSLLSTNVASDYTALTNKSQSGSTQLY